MCWSSKAIKIYTINLLAHNKKMSQLSFLAFLVLVALHHLPHLAAQCSRHPVVVNFGDSNSDTGGLAADYGITLGLPDGRAFFHSPTGGRFCDGRLIIDFFCENLKTSGYLSPYLESIGPDFRNGVNFAIGGATTNQSNLNLGFQINQFKRFRNRSIEFKSKGFNNLVGEEDFKNALYTIDIGLNDLKLALTFSTYAETIDQIPSFISNIRDAMSAIYELGGKNFWVHNTGPIGCLPKFLAAKQTNATDYDKIGCLMSWNAAAQEFNVQLNTLCQQLRQNMTNSTIVYVDMYSAKYDLYANAASYGFKNPLMACWGSGGPPYNNEPGIDCRLTGCNVCEEQYLNWDGVHYTEAANSIVAQNILSTNYSTPPFRFNYFCNT